MRYPKTAGSVCDRERIPHRRLPARVDYFRLATPRLLLNATRQGGSSDRAGQISRNARLPRTLALKRKFRVARNTGRYPVVGARYSRSLQLGVFRLGLLENRDVGVGILPYGQEILIGTPGLDPVA